ncbi:hypothetical protein [Streptomyces sp. NPDC087437]|uniref:hypothetical protein n=1 Tax=Streptomyces sp. NPDC087437 TaxID=3365789 RepID=UPI003802B2C9
MSVYVSIRGWLECTEGQMEKLRKIVGDDSGHHYAGGWSFPIRNFNWTFYAFYGGDIQEQDVAWLLGLVERIAKIRGIDEDEEDSVRGLFLLSHEVNGLSEWQIRDGDVLVAPGSENHEYLA